jgi:hypothetical protein
MQMQVPDAKRVQVVVPIQGDASIKSQQAVNVQGEATQ